MACVTEAGEADQHHGPGRGLGNRGGDDHKQLNFTSFRKYKVSTRGKYRRIHGAGENLRAFEFDVPTSSPPFSSKL